MRNNQLDNFETLIKGSLEKQSAPYDPSDWDKLNNKLNKTNRPFYASPWFIAATIASILGTIYLTSLTSTPNGNNLPNLSEKNESTNYLISEEPKTNLDLNEEENSKIKEVFEKIETETKIVIETKDKTVKDITDSETNQSEYKEVESEYQEDKNTSEDNGFTPLDSDEELETNFEDNVVISIQKAAFYMNTFECCEGTSIKFVSEKQKDVDYLWSFDDDNYSKEENPSHLFENAGSYKVSLIVRSQTDNSIMTKSNDQLLIVHPNPKVDFNWEMNEENNIPYTSFINLTDKAINWSWNFGNGNISNEKDPNHTYRKKGQYLITLSATNEEGCANTINKDIFVDQDYNLLAPNSFTPNGDGLNDYFLPAALNRLNGTFTMTIYSANEGLIYKTKNIDQPWDGTNQKVGTKCKEGSYVWVVKLKNEEGKTEQYKGAILLLK